MSVIVEVWNGHFRATYFSDQIHEYSRLERHVVAMGIEHEDVASPYQSIVGQHDLEFAAAQEMGDGPQVDRRDSQTA